MAFIRKENGHKNDHNIYKLEAFQAYLWQELGIDITTLDYLACGEYGEAYLDLKTGWVVKFTTDYEEVLIAKKLMALDRELKQFAKIYAVGGECDGKYWKQQSVGMWVIVQSKLDTKNKELVESNNLIEEILRKKQWELMMNSGRKSIYCEYLFKDLVISKTLDELISQESDGSFMLLGEPCTEFCAKIIKESIEAANEFKEAIGKMPEDLHSKNMGIGSDGKIGFFDQTYC